MKNTTFLERLQSYGEIVGCSLALIVLASGLAIGSALGLKILLKEDTLRWEVLIVVGIVALLPLLIITAKVWVVNISLFGNKAGVTLPRPVNEGFDPSKAEIAPRRQPDG